MRFQATIYNDEGRILSVQTNATELALEGKQYIVGGVDGDLEDFYVSEGQIIPKGEQPSTGHIFNYATGLWELDLSLAKSLKWAEIKAARDTEEFSQFDWGGYTFQCDEVSQRRIQGAVQLAAIDNTMTLDWTLADNSVQSFTASEYVQIGQALANHVSQCHARGRILRNQIESATTETELEAIVW